MDGRLSDPVVKTPVRTPSVSSHCHHGKQGLEKLEDVLLRLPTAQVKDRDRKAISFVSAE